MRWKLKARLQNAIALLPSSLSYSLYYWAQRHFGGLRRVDPLPGFCAGLALWKAIRQVGRCPAGATFLEVGTGRQFSLPLALWLMGAEKTITADLNPYLKEELVRDDIAYVCAHRDVIGPLFEGFLQSARLDKLLALAAGQWRLRELLDLCGIEYLAPADASQLALPDASVDFHVSECVLEHVPPEALRAILAEGSRLLRPGGVMAHHIDYSDHFSDSDKSISPVNFLQFSDVQWARYAGNRYMYMNRLRHDDYVQILQSLGQRIILAELVRDETSLAMLRLGELPLDKRFQAKPPDVLAITSCLLVSDKALP